MNSAAQIPVMARATSGQASAPALTTGTSRSRTMWLPQSARRGERLRQPLQLCGVGVSGDSDYQPVVDHPHMRYASR